MTNPMETCSLFAGDRPGHCAACGDPLTGRRTRWCSEVCAATYGRNHWWGFARIAAMKRDDWKCVRCGSGHRLEVNHITPLNGGIRSNTCLNHLDNLETLCHDCHLGVTAEQFGYRRPRVVEPGLQGVLL